MNRILIVLLTLGISIGMDRWTKIWAVNNLQGQGRQSYLNDMLRITFAQNDGAFLSLGSGLNDELRFILLSVLPVLVLLYVLYLVLFSKDMDTWQVIAFSLIFAGGASNVFDRIMDGYVVDFLNVGMGSLRTGIFNVADMSIMAGLFMLLPLLFRNPKKK